MIPRSLNLTKRQKIVFSSLILAVVFIFTTLSPHIFYKRYYLILVFGLIGYLFSFWSLWEGFDKKSFSTNKTKLLTLFTLPTFFCIGIASFYFVLNPDYIRWLTRLPAAAVTGVFLYLILLSQNVFNVASQRTIPLYRAASTSSLLFTMFTAVLIFSVIYTLRLNFYSNGVFILLVSFILSLCVLWSVEMDKLSMPIIIYSFIISILVGEFAVAFSFWPITPLFWAISLATTLYILLGIVHHFLRDRLSRRLIGEYLWLGGAVFLVVVVLTSWIG